MYLAMARVAHREGYPEIGMYWEKAAFEEAEHAAKFAELCLATRGRYDRVALVTDVRAIDSVDDLFTASSGVLPLHGLFAFRAWRLGRSERLPLVTRNR